jgi:hypothetical protein
LQYQGEPIGQQNQAQNEKIIPTDGLLMRAAEVEDQAPDQRPEAPTNRQPAHDGPAHVDHQPAPAERP